MRRCVSPGGTAFIVLMLMLLSSLGGCAREDQLSSANRELCDTSATELGLDIWLLKANGVARPDWLSVKQRNPGTPQELRALYDDAVKVVDADTASAIAKDAVKQVCYRHFHVSSDT